MWKQMSNPQDDENKQLEDALRNFNSPKKEPRFFNTSSYSANVKLAKLFTIKDVK